MIIYNAVLCFMQNDLFQRCFEVFVLPPKRKLIEHFSQYGLILLEITPFLTVSISSPTKIPDLAHTSNHPTHILCQNMDGRVMVSSLYYLIRVHIYPSEADVYYFQSQPLKCIP